MVTPALQHTGVLVTTSDALIEQYQQDVRMHGLLQTDDRRRSSASGQ
jgi:hypothetical protein